MQATVMGSQPHTCVHCKRILLDKPVQREQQYGVYEVTLPHTRTDVFHALKAGCHFFALYPRIPFYTLSFIQSLRPSSWYPWFSPRYILKFRGWRKRRLWTLIKSMLNPFDRPFKITYNTQGDFDLNCITWMSEPESMRIVSPADDPSAQDLIYRPINNQVNSKEVFEFLNSQLLECYEKHVQQGTCPHSKEAFTPRRVIRISGTLESLSLQLYSPKATEKIRWTALSYCWGGQDQSLMTTMATLGERYEGIDLAKLPATLADAVHVTYRLGVKHIWIDSICIVQDNKLEIAEDLSRMDEIYRYAYFTLSAASASKVTDGFLKDRIIRQEQPPISLRYKTRSGVEGSLTVTREPTPADMPDPINARAWTFQERLLSPRLVEFSSTQVRWRCNTSIACQSGCPPQSPHKQYFNAALVVNQDTMSCTDPWENFQNWSSLVTLYSSRNLTYPADKLTAFSAIAKAVKREGRYLAGLWESDLPFNLLWKVYHVYFPLAGEIDKRQVRPATYRAPSWSWASVDGEVHCDSVSLDGSRPEAACMVLECQVNPASEILPYGPVVSGYIVILGRSRNAVFFPSTGALQFCDNPLSDANQESSEFGYKGFADVKDEQSCSDENSSMNVHCLHIRNFSGRAEGLLLAPDGDTYRRIGHFYWNVFEAGRDFQGSEIKTLKII